MNALAFALYARSVPRRSLVVAPMLLALVCAGASGAPTQDDLVPPKATTVAPKATVKTGSWEHAIFAYVPPK